ncbi:MAG: helix-turn-helix domain-containing protein [Chloroflexi bacterium]|nr:helix-turn-helix domain-containing protein [Chloroflexota bacterium]
MTDTQARLGKQESFGARLRQFRVRAGLTQEVLAERAGVAVATIAALEQGQRRRPYPHTVSALSSALGLRDEDRLGLFALTDSVRDHTPVVEHAERSAAAGIRQAVFQLPVTPTELIGRENDIRAVAQLFNAPASARLVTLIGPGGVGKTRLALAVAEALAGNYRDGVVFVDFSALRDHRLMAPTIANALRVRESGSHGAWEVVVAYLRDRHMLLVLDNLEHILDGAQVIAQLLNESPDLALLATSRIALRVRAETRFAVEPLAQPPAEAPLEVVAAAPAVRLFVERARAIAPGFALDSDNAQAVMAVCRRLESLPLAIELAAARVNVLGVRGLEQRLERPLPLLTAGSADLPARQQTLRNTLAWSYDLLGSGERTLFERLSIFADGWTLAAAEVVCSDDDLPLDEVLGRLQVLVDNSLVRCASASDDEPRFSMLHIVRDYARERAAESGVADALRARHCDWCVAFAEEAALEMTGPRQAYWLDRLDRVVDDFRAALDFITEQQDVETGLRLAGALGRFWATRRYVTEGREWLERFLTSPRTNDPPSMAQARACYAAGVLASIQGDPSQAAARLEESIELYHRVGNRVGVVRALNTRRGVAYDQGHLAFAGALWAQCLVQANAAGDLGEASHALGNLGEAQFHLGDLAAAETAFTEALSLAQRAGRTDLEAMQLGNLGSVARERGDLPSATEFQHRALVVKRSLGARRQIAITLEAIASIAAAEGRGARAARLLGAADTIRELIGTPQPLPERTATEHALAVACTALGETTWRRSFVEGRSLTMEQAIAYALE